MTLSCIIIDDEPSAIAELAELIENIPNLSLVGQFEGTMTALQFLEERKQVDIVFCDITMPKLTGIQAAALLRKYSDFLVYVTGYREHALDAYGVYASGYLLKPVNPQALINQIADIQVQRNKMQSHPSQQENTIFVKGGRKNSFIKIEVMDVIFIESCANYVDIYTIDGKYTTYISLRDIERELGKYTIFRRVSKSKIINISCITEVDGDTIRLEGRNTAVLGQTYKSAFHDYMRKRTLNP